MSTDCYVVGIYLNHEKHGHIESADMYGKIISYIESEEVSKDRPDQARRLYDILLEELHDRLGVTRVEWDCPVCGFHDSQTIAFPDGWNLLACCNCQRTFVGRLANGEISVAGTVIQEQGRKP